MVCVPSAFAGFSRMRKNLEKGVLAVAALCAVFWGLQACRQLNPDPQPVEMTRIDVARALGRAHPSFEFEHEFCTVLSTLILSAWDESGDWKGDLQGDATAFAPMLLYAFAHDVQEDLLRIMADRTVAHEARMVNQCLLWPVPSMEVVIGFPALAQPFLATGDDRYRRTFLRGVRLGYVLARYFPGALTPFVSDRASVYGATAYLCFTAARMADTADAREEFVLKGTALVEQAGDECWDGEEGRYTHQNMLDWPQGTMMMALVSAYRATGETRYLDQALSVLEYMDRCCLDEAGGFSGHPRPDTRALSGNNIMAWVFLDLYEATRDRRYLERARRVLAWIFSPDLFDPSEGLISHHWSAEEGRAGYSCTGCNFHTLVCVYRYNTLLKQGLSRRDRPSAALG